MDAFGAVSVGRDSEDALKVLGRVADAFDNPTSHKVDKELKLFVVNVVKSRQLLTSLPSEESVLRRDSCDSSFDMSSDEDVELVELGDVGIWEHAVSYPYASRRSTTAHKQRSCSGKLLRQDDGTYDVTKMLLTSSPLDRLDRLARMELKKTGWVERVDKWTIVEMGLQGGPEATTPPKTPSRKIQARDSWECYSPVKTTPPSGGKQGAPQTPRRSELLPGRGAGYSTPKRNERDKSDTPALMRSPVRSRDSDSHLADVSVLSYADVPRLPRPSTTTPTRGSRLSRTFLHGTRDQTRGRLGQVVRNIVKRMLPPSAVGGVDARSPSPRAGTETTPRSDGSGESGWTSGSGSSWREARHVQAERWSGFWH